MNTQTNLTAKELERIARINSKDWNFRTKMTGIMLILSCLLALVVLASSLSGPYSPKEFMPFLLFIGLCGFVYDHTSLCSIVKKMNQKIEPVGSAKPTPPGTSAAEQPRVPGSGAG
jgi:UDP-N-acetylmuramyl pentapeptide phosphotransferase/UDP-N-acetylglucosamine-1-phosphate transferase